MKIAIEQSVTLKGKTKYCEADYLRALSKRRVRLSAKLSLVKIFQPFILTVDSERIVMFDSAKLLLLFLTQYPGQQTL